MNWNRGEGGYSILDTGMLIALCLSVGIILIVLCVGGLLEGK